MPDFGFHVSIAGSVSRAPERAKELGCDVMQIFSTNPRTWRSSPLADKEIAQFKTNCKACHIKPVSVHSSYLINPGSSKKVTLKKSKQAFREELRRTSALGIPYYTIHPGSHGGSGEEVCIKRIAKSVDWVLEHVPARGVKILLETTAGQGTTVGYRFEHLRDVISFSEYPQRIGVCFDTCHSFAAGYDIRTHTSLEKVLSAFDRIIGLDALHLFHLNDSKRVLGSRVDRHEHIGRGKIGKTGFAALVNHKRFRDFPMILETPGDRKQDLKSIALLRELSC